MRTLVLNAGYEPLSVVSYRRAILLVGTGKASVLADGGDPVVGPSCTLRRPAVIAEPWGPGAGGVAVRGRGRWTAGPVAEPMVRVNWAEGWNLETGRPNLTPELAGTWHPDARTLVHRGDAAPVPRLEDNEYRVNLEVDSVVDGSGVIERKPAGATEVLDFDVVQVDGQWRISDAPDATALAPLGRRSGGRSARL